MQSIVFYKYAVFHNFTGFVVTLKNTHQFDNINIANSVIVASCYVV